MHAVVFDIDGTLLDSNGVDGELYIAAVQLVLGRVRIRASWREYQHVTDAGILNAILLDNGISGDASIIAAIKRTFVDSLRHHIEVYGPFSEIPGARDFVNRLCATADLACAYATGCWSTSALLKLRSAGFPVQRIPISSADDSYERCAIMENALRQLGNRFESVTYYGDGAWDRKAALSLGWRFVPVGAELGGISKFEELAPNSALLPDIYTSPLRAQRGAAKRER
jgi:FMN phosphatase YigB (HAD superfamily)